MTFEQAEARVARLRRGRIAILSAREDIDRPVDPQLQVATTLDRHKLSLVIEGQEVSSLKVVDFQQQIGSAVVRMGGIADVYTHKDHRFQGHARRLLESSLYWMRAEGFDTAMLYGVPSLYPKFGYAQAFPGVCFSLTVRDAERIPAGGHRLVNFAPKHLRAVLRMYHRNNLGRTGPTRRDPKTWRPFRKGTEYGTQAVCKVALDARDRPIGYIVYDARPMRATVIEVGFAVTGVFPDMLRAAARLAMKDRLERIQFILPEDDAFMEFCQPLGLRKETTHRGNGGGQVRMINIPSALAQVASDVGPRLGGAGRLTIRTNLDDVGLAWSGGRLTVGPPRRDGPQARLPQWALAQLLYGYRSADALIADGALKASAAAAAVLSEVFPVHPHFHYLVDHF